jgi:hypothetical protein
MRSPILIRSAFGITLFIALGVLPVYTQNLKAVPPQDKYLVDNETYEQVLDSLFPRNALAGVFGYSFIIRYRPTTESESQITVINEAGKIEVVEYTPMNGNIYEQLNKIFKRTRRQNAAYMTKQIRINKRILNLSPSEVQRIRESLYEHIRLSAGYEAEIVNENMETAPLLIDDGVRYGLWYRGAGRFHYDLIGSSGYLLTHTDKHPLIQWMKDVRRTINKLPDASRSNN